MQHQNMKWNNIKLRNLWFVLLDQGPFTRFIRNLFKGHFVGLFSKRSHYNANGKPKVKYNTKVSAEKAAKAMIKKRDLYFSNYKCVHCDGFHIGKNSENKG